MHARIRTATRLDHQYVDQAISRFDLASPRGYAAFLGVNAAALASLRPHWRQQDVIDFDGLRVALSEDLVSLGEAAFAPAVAPGGPIDGLGLAYVVRGARLGARILRLRVPAGFPSAYLDFTPALAWPLLLRQLDDRIEGAPGLADEILQGARATFAVYAHFARRCDVPA